MAALAACVRHAEQHGGGRDLWETARTELEPVDLGRLAEALRKIEPRRHPGNGRAIEQPFALTRARTCTADRAAARGQSVRLGHPTLHRGVLGRSRHGP